MIRSYTRDKYNSLIYQYAQATIINDNITLQNLHHQLNSDSDFFKELIYSKDSWLGNIEGELSIIYYGGNKAAPLQPFFKRAFEGCQKRTTEGHTYENNCELHSDLTTAIAYCILKRGTWVQIIKMINPAMALPDIV